MSAETLRRAAALMRERAEAFDSSDWSKVVDAPDWDGPDDVIAEGIYLASWHPSVALAVADWLDWTLDEVYGGDPLPADHPAVAVARAYVGEQS